MFRWFYVFRRPCPTSLSVFSKCVVRKMAQFRLFSRSLGAVVLFFHVHVLLSSTTPFLELIESFFRVYLFSSNRVLDPSFSFLLTPESILAYGLSPPFPQAFWLLFRFSSFSLFMNLMIVYVRRYYPVHMRFPIPPFRSCAFPIF